MSLPSFKSLARDGQIKKADLFRAPPDKLVMEWGFNLREEGPELEAHIDAICQFILDGGQLPPLEVRVGSDGELIVVDGHCRLRAYQRAIEGGAQIEFIDCLPFRGNDAERVARIITSQLGKPLTPLEVAQGYARLVAFGWSAEQIARKGAKTRQHVESMLLLAGANSDVHQLVRAGSVAATTAIEAVRQHGEKAGQVLASAVETAGKQGKKRATSSMVRGPSIPRKVWAPMVGAVDHAISGLPESTRTTLSNALADPEKYVGATVPVSVPLLAELMATHQQLEEQRKKLAQKVTCNDA